MMMEGIFFVKETVSNEWSITFIDKCSQKIMVMEYYCQGESITSVRHSCLGDCVGSVCLKT